MHGHVATKIVGLR